MMKWCSLRGFKLIVSKEVIVHTFLCSFILTLYTYLFRGRQFDENIFEATLVTLSTLDFDLLHMIIPVLVFSLPFVSFISLCGDGMYREFFDRGTIILTRLKHNKYWFIQMIEELLIKSGSFSLILIVITSFMNFCLEYHLSIQFLTEIVSFYFLLMLFLMVMTLFSNLICFLTKSYLGGLSVIVLFYVSIFMSAYLYERHPSLLWMIKWLPASQIVMSWHFELMNFTIGYSCLYLLISFAILCGVLYKIFINLENY